MTGNQWQLALEIIIKQYRDHPQSLPLLQDRAENDPDEKVREFVQREIGAIRNGKLELTVFYATSFLISITYSLLS